MARFELATFCPPDAQIVTKMTSKYADFLNVTEPLLNTLLIL